MVLWRLIIPRFGPLAMFPRDVPATGRQRMAVRGSAWWTEGRSDGGWTSSRPESVIEDLAVGRYVVVRGSHKRFFCMVTDIALDTTNPAIRSDPPDLSDPFLREIYAGTAAFGTIHVAPMLTIDETEGEPRPVKTIPSHFMPVEIATAEDVDDVFGREDPTHFNVGAPLELEETQINLDLRRLVERSIGVFGKSGTGKSFLTRILLAGIIKNKVAANLIFDMHNDYGWAVRDEGGAQAKGLKQLFGEQIAIFTLDEEASLRRKAKLDYIVRISYRDIRPKTWDAEDHSRPVRLHAPPLTIFRKEGRTLEERPDHAEAKRRLR